jgi:putative component of toxin-antitoxin plasmid stabilization module
MSQHNTESLFLSDFGLFSEDRSLLKDCDFRVKYKTEICRNWELGTCEFGDNCAFAHGIEELRNKVNMGLKYKTKKCKQFHEQGVCQYGSRCQFKHRDTADTTPVVSPKSVTACQVFFESAKKRLRVFVEISQRNLT